MAKFVYHGRNPLGKEVKGIIESKDEGAVASELVKGGITPTFIEVYTESEHFTKQVINFITRQEPSAQDLSFFSRQLYTLMKAGVPIVRAIKVVLESSKNLELKKALADVLASIEGGQSFASSMRHHPTVFPPLMSALIGVGENTGGLVPTFQQLSTHFERELRTKKQIAAALRYPFIVVIVISIAITIVNILVIPSFAGFFSKFKTDLPIPTQILIATSHFFVHYWYILAVMVLGVIGGAIYFVRSPQGKPIWDRLKLKIPLIGYILNLALLARFARSFALSMRTGVPLLESIGLIAKAADNDYIGDKIIGMREYIERGESLTIAANKSDIFTPLILQMLSIGEETGEIDRLLDEVADYYESEVDYKVERLGDAIEPILISVIAVLVLILALGIFLPMWDLWKVAIVN